MIRKQNILLFLLLIIGCDEPSIYGCIDRQACNYDADATISMGCQYIIDDCGTCGGTIFGYCSISDKAQLNSPELCESAEGIWIIICD